MTDSINQDIALLILITSALLIILCIFIVAVTILYLNKKKQEKIEKEQREAAFAGTLLQTQLEIREQTLQNISHELHDNIGQLVSLINIHLSVIKRGNINDASNSVVEAKKLIKILVRDIKQLALDLNGNRFATIGLVLALKEEVERLQKLGLFHIDFQVVGNEFPLSKNKTIILYRMSQEILNNIIKHSNAKEVLIKILFEENLLTLVFHDNGLGFNTEEKSKFGGNGLINLQNRAHLINAHLVIKSGQDKGTTVTIEMHK